MKLLPTEPGQRRRLILMILALVVLGAAYMAWGRDPELVIPKTLGPAPTSKSPVTTRAQSGRRAEPTMPQPLRLAEMEQVPDEPPAGGRNLFRFGVRVMPTPPPPPPPPFTPTPTPTPPPPLGPPPIPLWVTTIIPVDPPAKPRAYLHDKNNNPFEGVEGDIIDGRYRLVKVGSTSVVVTYLDGTGQKVIYIGG